MGIVGWLSWVVCVIGLWFVASPWIFGFTSQPALMWNSIILGAVTAILSAIVGYVLVAMAVVQPRHAKA
jgi:ethanolamine transporter EutH